MDINRDIESTQSAKQPVSHPNTSQALLLALNAAATSLQRSIQSEEKVYEAFSEQVLNLGLRGGISLLDHSGNNLIFKVVAYVNPVQRAMEQVEKVLGIRAKGYKIPVDRVDVYRQVIREGIAVYIPNTSLVTAQVMPDKIQPIAKPLLSALGNPPGIFAPLIVEGKVKGMLNMVGKNLTNNDTPALQAFANHIAITLENAHLVENLHNTMDELQSAYRATLEGWIQALDLRDHETEGHTQRVTEITLQLALKMGVPEEQLQHIRRGALLHDIGKMAIPDAILRKPGYLTIEEWNIMRRHPELAYKWLSSIDYLLPALAIPYCHHERWDGSGYPRGLQAEQIPYEARLFAVVDVWDAMTSARPYRDALSRNEAELYIREQAGKHFDPRISDGFLLLMKDEQINWYS